VRLRRRHGEVAGFATIGCGHRSGIVWSSFSFGDFPHRRRRLLLGLAGKQGGRGGNDQRDEFDSAHGDSVAGMGCLLKNSQITMAASKSRISRPLRRIQPIG
jgi:hypothetical protein